MLNTKELKENFMGTKKQNHRQTVRCIRRILKRTYEPNDMSPHKMNVIGYGSGLSNKSITKSED